MKNRHLLALIGKLVAVTLIVVPNSLLIPNISRADGLEEASAEYLEEIGRGGQLYDNFFRIIPMESPKKSHPSYPAEGKRKGRTTWRCVECHGWDYKGKHGAYRSGEHYTGVLGIRNMTGSSEKTVVDILKDAVHGYGELIPDSELEALAVFVVDGQIDMDRYIDRKTGKAKGDHARGARIFQTVCIKCHGSDGKLMNFGDEKNPEYVGTWATENPWATLHKIRMGQPGQVMPAMIAFRIQAQVDLLAHAQTLPIK